MFSVAPSFCLAIHYTHFVATGHHFLACQIKIEHNSAYYRQNQSSTGKTSQHSLRYIATITITVVSVNSLHCASSSLYLLCSQCCRRGMTAHFLFLVYDIAIYLYLFCRINIRRHSWYARLPACSCDELRPAVHRNCGAADGAWASVSLCLRGWFSRCDQRCSICWQTSQLSIHTGKNRFLCAISSFYMVIHVWQKHVLWTCPPCTFRNDVIC